MAEIRWPFLGAEALEAGLLTARELRRFYRPIYPGVYALRGAHPSAVERAGAAWLWSRRRGVVAGLSAQAVLGVKWVEPGLPAQLIHTNQRTPPMLAVHADTLGAGEAKKVTGMTVTTPGRTAFDIGRRSSFLEGVQRIDALMNATGVKVADIEAVAALHPGVRGLTRLRRTLAFVDGGAESPYESMTRLALAQAGLPPVQTQIEVARRSGTSFARIDMGWPEYLVGVEFDGAHHWTDSRQRTRDIDRLARLQELGWAIVRVSSGLLHNRRDVFLARTSAALLARGCPKTW